MGMLNWINSLLSGKVDAPKVVAGGMKGEKVGGKTVYRFSAPQIGKTPSSGPAYERSSRRNNRPHRWCWTPIRWKGFLVTRSGTVYDPKPTGWRRLGVLSGNVLRKMS